MITAMFEQPDFETEDGCDRISAICHAAAAGYHWRIVAGEPDDSIPPMLVFWTGHVDPSDRELTEAIERYEMS
jgi:hypothetical protein